MLHAPTAILLLLLLLLSSPYPSSSPWSHCIRHDALSLLSLLSLQLTLELTGEEGFDVAHRVIRGGKSIVWRVG